MLLSGWKEISGHLRCAVRTAQRYERVGLPISRPLAGRRSHVIADSRLLDEWLLEDSFRHRSVDLPNVIQRNRELRAQVQHSRENLRQTMHALVEELSALRLTASRHLIDWPPQKREFQILDVQSKIHHKA